MFERRRHRTRIGGGLGLLALIYHATVRQMRKGNRNALLGLLTNMVQAVVMLVGFMLMFQAMGIRGSPIRGDYVVYLLSGIFLFLTHNKAVTAVYGAEGPTSPMMKHAPMNTVVTIAAAALAALYTQVLTIAVILLALHVVRGPVEIADPIAWMGFTGLAWFTGVTIGLLLMSLKPFAPAATKIVMQVYTRANMITSGKMFVANAMPGFMLPLFTWNPLFHTIDQARGAAFVNYNPHNSTPDYPLYVGLTLLLLGLIAEFSARRNASLSRQALH
jgi:ABC-type polysaccharide/polyol phosphate export permease